MDCNYSVLMTVYKKDVPEWLKISIESMISQTLQPFEIVVVCDGELNDELYGVLDTYKNQFSDLIKIYKLEKNVGLGLALRFGVEKCSCEYIARMDADDISAPERCMKQMQKMQSDSRLSMVSSITYEFSGSIDNIVSHRMMPETHEEIMKFSKKRTPFVHPGFMFKKSAMLAAGNYAHCPFAEDYDVMTRMLQNGCIGYNFQEPLIFMRVNEDFYGRRGGADYLAHMINFNKILYRRKFINLWQCVRRSAAQVAVCLMPNNFRSWIYKRLLRKEGDTDANKGSSGGIKYECGRNRELHNEYLSKN